MEEMRQITLEEWMSWKEDIREKLKETAGNFVYIGYRLKQIRDSGMYGGAADIFEFAQAEYGLGKSTVSRFIAINEKFSEGGNSLELKAEYRDIGSSKLSEMLTLTDSECRLITERTTVKEIRELKNFSRQQAPEDGADRTELTPLRKCIVEYFRDKRQALNEAVAAFYGNEIKNASEIINPGGYRTFQKGLVFLFMYDFQNGVKYKTFGSQEITEMSWEEFLMEVSGIFGPVYEQGEKDIHGAFYGPEKVEETQETQGFEAPVATSQQEENETENGEEDREEKEVLKAPKRQAEKPAGKTDEQRYSEEQDRIDRETKKRLQEQEDRKRMEILPSDREQGRKVHDIKTAPSCYAEVESGRRRFDLRKNDRGYKAGDGLRLLEFKDGKHTGRVMDADITYVMEDCTGLEDGYCILGFDLADGSEKVVETDGEEQLPGQMNMDDYLESQEN